MDNRNNKNKMADKVNAKVDDLKRTGKEVAAELKTSGQEIATELKSTGKDMAADFKKTAMEATEEKKHAASSKIGEFSEALGAMSEKLDEGNHPVSSAVHQLSDSCRSAADYVDSTPLQTMLGDAAAVCKKYPELVIGGLFLGGLAAARVLKSSSIEQLGDSESSGNDLASSNSGVGMSRYRDPSQPTAAPSGVHAEAPKAPREPLHH